MVKQNPKINRKKNEVKSYGVKNERRLKGCFSFLFQKQPNMEHSKGHQAWNLPLATKLGSSFVFFLPLLFKGTNLDHLFISFWM
jgi:hypothetical protein